MDSQHNKNVYTTNSTKDNLYGGYGRPPCAQQSSQRPQHFLPPYAMPVPMSNNMQQQLMYNSQGQPMYNIVYGPQSMYRNQNAFPQTMDPVPWIPEPCEQPPKDKYIKYDMKLKDNSPTNCCSTRVDNLTCSPLSDMYKTVNKNFYYNNMEPQWFYGSNYDNQKYNELPSCSQITPDISDECCNARDTNKTIKSVKYCSIQKYPEPDPKLYIYPNNHNELYVNQQYNKIPKDYASCSQLTQTCNLYPGSSTCLEIDKKMLLDHCDVTSPCDLILPSASSQGFFTNTANDCTETSLQPFDVLKIDDKTTEESNGGGGESDIVVEDSDEEVSDESEELEKEDETQQCFVCNVTTTGNQFYIITQKTSYSQTLVHTKLSNLFDASTSSNHLCSACMNLLNTLDNLEIQLNNVKRELIEKYKSTRDNLKLYIDNKKPIQDNNTDIKSSLKNRKTIKFKLKKVCGLHSFKCKVCEKIFSLKKFYKYHMSKHKINTSYLCEHCGCHFNKCSNLRAHLRRHRNNFKIRCSICNKGFIYESSLRQHKCHKNKIKSFVCHICGKTFRTRTNLKEHEHFCSGVLPYACGKCEKRFPSSTKLKHHERLQHDKNYTENCPTCGKGFVKQSDYKAHLLSHSSDRKYECTVCRKSYKTLSNLNHHSKIHQDKLPFSCNICNKGFLRKENLESHLNIHNGLKPFECEICDKKFAAQKNLDAHLRVHKGTTKKKTCTICGKQVSHGLEEHIRTHSNSKEFECEGCTMKFSTKGALAKHRKRKHENIDLDVL